MRIRPFVAVTFLSASVLACRPAIEASSVRVIGGELARPGDWPETVFMALRNAPGICTGVVVGDNAVLTAAHCVSQNLAEGDIAAIEGHVVDPEVSWQQDWTNVPGRRALEVFVPDETRSIHTYVWDSQDHARDLAVLRFPDATFTRAYKVARGPLEGSTWARLVGYGYDSNRPRYTIQDEYPKSSGKTLILKREGGLYHFRGTIAADAGYRRRDASTGRVEILVAAAKGDSGGPLLAAGEDGRSSRSVYGTCVGGLGRVAREKASELIYTDLSSDPARALLRRAAAGGARVRGVNVP